MATQKYCKINGSLVNYSNADPVTLSSSTSAPDQCDFVIQLAYSATFPVVGNKVQWYTKADVLIWAGVISEIDWSGMYEGASLLHVPIKAVGFNDRLYHRTTWNRATFRCAQYRSFTSVVNTQDVSGVGTCFWSSGDKFSDVLVGKTVLVNGGSKVIATVPSPDKLTLTSTIGTHSGYDFVFTVYSGDVVKDLLDTHADFEGFTYGSGTTTIQNGAALDSKGVVFDPPVTVMDAISSVLASNPTFYFACDPTQICYFGVRTQVAAPADFNNTATPQKRGILVRTTAEDVRNCEISTTTWDAIEPRSETFTGDGVTTSWFLTHRIAQLVDITLNGVAVSSADGTGTTTDEDFFFQPNDKAIWQNPAGVVLSAADSIVVRYKALADNLIEYSDDTARAARATIEGSGFGRYEQSIDRTALSGKTAALAESTNSVNRLKSNYQEATVKTFALGYRVGQLVNITIDKERLSTVAMFIDAVKMTDSGLKGTIYDFEYELTCISITRRLTDADVLRSLFGFGAPPIGTSGGPGAGAVDPPNGLSFTPALYQYGTLTVENIALSSPGGGVRGIYFYVVYVDELTADCYAAAPTGIGSGTDPLSITVTPNPGQTSSLAFVVGDWILWNDQGHYEIGLLTAKSGNNWTIQRHYPGEAAGLSTFEAPMVAHAASINLFKLQVRRFLLNASETGFNDDPTARFDMPLPAACVAAITAAPYNDGGLGDWFTYNCATATVPGIRTLTGGNYTFQRSGTMATGTLIAVDKGVQLRQPIRVIYARLGTAPTGSSFKLTPRISLNGGSSYSTLIGQLEILAASKNSYTVGNEPDNKQVPYAGSWPFPILDLSNLLNLNVDQVGSTVAGADLSLEIFT